MAKTQVGKKTLKERLAEQERRNTNLRTADVDPDTTEDDPSTDDDDDEDEGGTTTGEGFDDSAPLDDPGDESPDDDDDEGEDLDAFDLDDMGGANTDDGSDDDEGDDADASDLEITHDDDSGDMDIHHEGGDDDDEEGDDTSADLNDDDDLPGGDDDLDEECDDTDASDLEITHDEETGDMDIHHEGDDDEGDDAKAWVDTNIVAGMLTAHLRDNTPKTQEAAVTVLREAHLPGGAEVVKSLSTRQFAKLDSLLAPVYSSGSQALRDVRAAQSRMKTIQQRAAAAGDPDRAAKIEKQFQTAIQADLEEVDYRFDAPSWLTFRAAAWVQAEMEIQADGEGDDTGVNDGSGDDLDDDDDDDDDDDMPPDAGVDTTASSSAILASVTDQLVQSKFTRKAAKILVNASTADALEAARVVSRLVRSGKAGIAAQMVAELRQAGYNVDPDVKPTVMDPSQPITPGAPNRMMGPPPDSGSSYGMSEEDANKVCTTLGCSKEALAWVAKPPKNMTSPNARWSCYTEMCGEGPTKDMSVDEVKAYLSKKAIAVHAVYLADLDALRQANVGKDDISMELWDAQGQDPYWNITVGGDPVGRIRLSRQANPDIIRNVFTSETYADGFRQACADYGPIPALETVRADVFATTFNESDVAMRAQERVAGVADKMMDERVNRRVHDLIDLALLANTEFERNISKVPNPLKWSLHERLAAAGVVNPIAVYEDALSFQIEAGVNDKDEPVYEPVLGTYLKLVFARAEELSKMPPEALQFIAREIIQHPVEIRTASILPESSETLRERLARVSIPVVGMGFGEDPGVHPSNSGVNADVLREALRHARTRNRG